MRALAALGVFVYHVNVVAPFGGSESQYAGRANTGVVLFYLISGFLLWRPFALSLLSGGPLPDIRVYAWRRFLRIVPAYWFALTMLLLVSSHSNATPGGPLPYYFFLQSYDPAWKNHGIGQAWTLCVEVAFYALLPVVAVLLASLKARTEHSRRRTMWIAIGVLVAASLIYKIAVLETVAPAKLAFTPHPWVLPWALDQFAVGMAFAVLSVGGGRLGATVDRAPAVPWLIAALAYWVMSRHLTVHDEPTVLVRHYLEVAVAAGLIVPAIFGEPRRGAVRRVLSSRVLVGIGLISYSFYLFHLTILRRIGDHVDSSLAVGGLALVATCAVSAGTYFFVERQALEFKRVVRPRRPRALATRAQP